MRRGVATVAGGGFAVLLLAGCGSTTPLPPYEAPIAQTHFQSVRTTAYTHTEADHLAYGNHNALGGTLHAAMPQNPANEPAGTLTTVSPEGTREDPMEGGFRPAGSLRPTLNVTANSVPPASIPTSGVGSAAADWSRWPAGTVFRIAATGQVYEVDDYGWALAGRNTIDLYQPTRADMSAWGARRVDIEILRWGDPAESLRKLRHHQDYRHIHRMVLELEGRAREAAALD